MNNIQLLIEKHNKITPEIEQCFLSIVDDFEEEIPRLRFLKSIYPGMQVNLPEKIRAVIINDISLLNIYKNTIIGFLSKGIPVIIISNRMIENIRDLKFYESLVKQNMNIFRLNWNKKKLSELRKYDNHNTLFIDQNLWDVCIRYIDQKIEIEVFEGNQLDVIMPELQNKITNLNEFKKLKKIFYDSFYTAIYALKNSFTTNEEIKALILRFEKYFNEVKYYGLEPELRSLIEEAIEVALTFEENTKMFNPDDNIFSNLVMKFEDKELFIPNNRNFTMIPTSETEEVIFTGYPYNENFGYYLLNTIFIDFIPNIKILCWPNEAQLTFNYIERRLQSGYFTDNIPSNNLFLDKYIIKSSDDVKNEINTLLSIVNNDFPVIDITFDQEENIEKFKMLKYEGYSNHSDIGSISTVKCDIVNFNNGYFMFLPKGSSILSEVETTDGKITIRKMMFKEMSVGIRIFKYVKDRTAYREISRHNSEVKTAFSKLELWKEALGKTYKDVNEDIVGLEKILKETKHKYHLSGGNPSRINIQRWLHDEEIIAPDKENIRIILYAANIQEIDSAIRELIISYRKVVSFTIKLSASIKKHIIKKIPEIDLTSENDFNINIFDSEIEVQSRVITALEKSQIEIDYRNTRKILC